MKWEDVLLQLKRTMVGYAEQAVLFFRLKLDFNAVFYAQILSISDVVHYLEKRAIGKTMKNLNEEIVKKSCTVYHPATAECDFSED